MKKVAFTIVLNGMPFIKQQFDTITDNFDHWYIIEGPAKPVGCTNWCGDVTKEFLSDSNLSNDGTTEYLNEISNYKKVSVIRTNPVDGIHPFWNGKAEMCNQIFTYLTPPYILFQIDVDEFWTTQVLQDVFNYLEHNDNYNVVRFESNFYYGDNIFSNGTNSWDWVRAWKVTIPTKWKSHEPPSLCGLSRMMPKSDTIKRGWWFDHYAYTTEAQLKFKEVYYKYKGAVDRWKRLQEVKTFPVYLRDYFPWIKNNDMAIKEKPLGNTSNGK